MNASNEKTLKVLEQQYKGFINTTDWDFFRGLAEYVKTVQETIPTKHIVEVLEKQQEVARKPYEIMSATALEELSKSAEKMIEITEKLSKEYDKYKPVTQKIDEIKAQLAGTLWSTNPLHNLDSNIMDVAIQIKALGYPDAIKQFEDDTKRTKNIYGNYVFSPTYEKIATEEKKLERRKETEAWGAWSELPIVEKVILEPEELNKEARKGVEHLRGRKNFRSYVIDELEDIRVQEMDYIRSGKIEAEKAIFFKLTNYKDYARRIHIYITTELIKTDTEVANLHADTFLKAGVVIFNDNEAKISLEGKNCQLPPHKNEHYLCRTMFEYPSNEAVDWSEVFEKMNNFSVKPTKRNVKKDRKSVQDTAYAVNKRIKEVLRTEDDLFSWKSNSIIRNF